MITALVVAALVGGAADKPAEAKKVEFFEGSFKDAAARAESKKLPLFVDFYTDW